MIKDYQNELDEIVNRYEQKPAALLPVLHYVQAKEGFITNPACGVAAAYVKCEIFDAGLLDGGVTCKKTVDTTKKQRCR